MNGFIWFLLGIAVSAMTFFILWQHHAHKRQKRLLYLVDYLEAASCGKETILTRMEDEFSLLEDELYKTVSELRIAREQAQKERKKQADNLADIAHQLKTPLTSMFLMTQLLTESASFEQQEYLVRLDNQLTRLDWLTQSLLTMSRLDARAIVFTKKEISFEALTILCTEAIEQSIIERNQMLLITGSQIFLSCDIHWTTEALLNLIKNCSEHTPDGGKITLSCTETPLYKQIVVEDNGSGFPSEDIPYLFQRFYRGKNSKKDSIGIGLSLSKAIIESQGGILRAENGKECGAKFILRFYP